MSSGGSNIAQEILRQLNVLSSKIDGVEDRFIDKVDKITEQLGGSDGIRERLTALEIRVEKLSSKSVYPPPVKVSSKPSRNLKEHASTAGIASAVVIVLETVGQLLLKK